MSNYINKALAPLAYQPVISRIIAKFPRDTHYVIAIGYLESLVRDFIGIAYPDLDVQFVRVDNYDQPGSGPGYSLLCCRSYLQQPFFLTTCDTLVEEVILEVNEDWVGVASHPDIEQYCSMQVDAEGWVRRIDYKQPIQGNLAFIGIAGIYHTDQFWQALSSDRQLIFGEHQIANGLMGLVPTGLRARRFTWFDTGDLAGLAAANQHYGSDFINFDKENEFLYFVEGSVIKFFADPEIVRRRVERNRVLGPTCPPVVASRTNFYRYPYIEGDSFAQRVDDKRFMHFLQWCRQNLWIPHQLTPAEMQEFRSLCRAFYRDKTLHRLKQFHKTTGVSDQPEVINGYAVPTVQELMELIDWDYLSQGIPVGFHGDLHFDNTVIPANPEDGDFRLLDWRQDFCGKIEYGDWYYDLGKIHHELIISHDQIKADAYEIDRRGEEVRFTYLTRSDYLSCQKVIRNFIAEQGLDYRKVLVLTHLIFLNMSPLHHYPFNLLLYYLGKLGLYQLLVEGYIQL
jgi:hypothetical protein